MNHVRRHIAAFPRRVGLRLTVHRERHLATLNHMRRLCSHECDWDTVLLVHLPKHTDARSRRILAVPSIHFHPWQKSTAAIERR
jgi:hypothetical protein